MNDFSDLKLLFILLGRSIVNVKVYWRLRERFAIILGSILVDTIICIHTFLGIYSGTDFRIWGYSFGYRRRDRVPLSADWIFRILSHAKPYYLHIIAIDHNSHRNTADYSKWSFYCLYVKVKVIKSHCVKNDHFHGIYFLFLVNICRVKELSSQHDWSLSCTV